MGARLLGCGLNIKWFHSFMADKGYTRSITNLTYYGNAHALAFILIAQVIYLNFHYIVGAVVIALGCTSLIIQIVMSTVERVYLGRKNYDTLVTVMTTHFYLNHAIMVVFIAIMIWEIIYMLQHQRTQ
jgi:hypothetical protein